MNMSGVQDMYIEDNVGGTRSVYLRGRLSVMHGDCGSSLP